MPTPKKEEVVQELTEKFKNATALYLADFKGMDMATTTKLRKKFNGEEIEYKVVKNTLSKLALKNAGIEGLDDHFKGVTAIAMTTTDPTKPARVISDFNKAAEGDGLKLKACLFEGVIYGPDRVDALANLPTREELIATFALTLKAPMTKFVSTIASPLQKTLAALNAIKDKK
jgi:large subunit ribosomal protein L10